MEVIGRHKAAFLKSILPKNRTEEQQSQLEAYDQSSSIYETPESIEAIKKYSEKIFAPREDVKERKVVIDELYQAFKFCFKKLTGKVLSLSPEAVNDYKTLIYYFSDDPRFFNCKNISDLSIPSLSKGLLIVGGYGNGKTSCMIALSMALQPYFAKQFRFYSTNEIVTLYEQCISPDDKRTFWNRMSNGKKCFDELNKEDMASNFGKKDIVKQLIERRYENRVQTYTICNYREDKPNDLEACLLQIGERYGSHIYDRLFEMFNIVEFKGKSFRR